MTPKKIKRFDNIALQHVVDKHESGFWMISKHLSNFLIKQGIYVRVYLNHKGATEYHWFRDNSVPLSKDEHLNAFIKRGPSCF